MTVSFSTTHNAPPNIRCSPSSSWSTNLALPHISQSSSRAYSHSENDTAIGAPWGDSIYIQRKPLGEHCWLRYAQRPHEAKLPVLPVYLEKNAAKKWGRP